MRVENLSRQESFFTFKKQLNVVWLLLFGLFTVYSAPAQQPLTASPDRGTGGNAPFAASGIDAVNLQNGNMTVKVPLASLPPIAGGKLSYTLTAAYNSKLWNSYKSEAVRSGGCPTSYTAEDIQYAGGWKIGGTYGITLRNARDGYDYQVPSATCDPIESGRMAGQFFKPVLTTPDGSEHEMRFLDVYPKYTGDKPFLQNYYHAPSTGPAVTGPVTMYSTDGSFLRAVYDPSSTSVLWTIYMNDGTRIVQSPDGTQRIMDANDNSIKFYYADGYLRVRDEQSGREIKYRATGGFISEVQYQAAGGVWETVTINWGETAVRGKLYSTENFCDDSSVPDPPPNFNYEYKELGGGTGQIPVIREIIFPATETGVAPPKYTFAYNSDTTEQVTSTNVVTGCGSITPSYTRTASFGFGELSEINTPSGSEINYSYSLDGVHKFGALGGGGSDEIVSNAVTTKSVTHDGRTDTWSYNIDSSGFSSSGSVTNPDGSTAAEAWYPTNPLLAHQFAGTDGKGGLVYRSAQSNKVMTERHWTLMPFTGADEFSTGAAGEKVGFNPVTDAEYTTLLDDSGNKVLMTAKTFQYDYNGNLLQTTDYDWFDPATVSRDGFGIPTGVPSGATVLRVSALGYYNGATTAGSGNVYAVRSTTSGPTVLNAVQTTSTGSASTPQSQARISYDGQSYGTAPTKGNPTLAEAWNDTNGTWISSGTGYDAYGNVISKTDGRGNTSYIYYEDSTHAMPTKTIVDPQNGTGQQISTATYDFSTGLPLSSTDINGNVSSIDYTNLLLGAVDPFGRAGTAYGPYINVGGTNKRLTAKTYYEDAARRTRSQADLFAEGDALVKTRASRDQLGRPVLSEKNENGASVYTISSETIYGAPADRTVMSSNPHRAGAAPTDGWRRVKSDLLGRGTEAATFSGAAPPPASGTNANWTGSVTTAYAGNLTTTADQAGKTRRSVTNALGQLTRVDEPNAAGQLDVSGIPAQPTNYTYDVLGNLTQVQQTGTTAQQCGAGATPCTQTRTFVYDSLSRLKQATNPEAGAINYAYDANSNLTEKTDARSITTTYAYDALNRVTGRSYSDSTPAVTYTYDNLTNAKGKLTKVASSNSTTEYTSFDILGRVTGHKQSTGGNDYTTAYTYNLSGALIEETYPNGRVVRNTLDANGDLAQVSSKKDANYGFLNYAGAFTYTAAGAVSSMRLGNGKWESTTFNSRLQPTQIALGGVQNATNLLKLNYSYGTTSNNGNVLTQQNTVQAIGAQSGFTATQTYTYDELNRLSSAEEKNDATSAQMWKQTFTFDRFGNRNFDEANTTATTSFPKNCGTAPSLTVCTADRKVSNPSVNANNNRLSASDGYSFDSAGNTTVDAQGRTFIYDAENKQIEVKDSSNVTVGQYLYDGDGKRIKKLSAAEETIFVYDAAGKEIAEYSTALNPTPQTSYLTADNLGTPRINTDQTGAVISRHDYQPYGEEIATPERNAGLKYQDDAVRKQFTGYERDKETDLDYAQARMFSSGFGRFNSPDPLLSSGRVEAPQTWNRYIYVQNNPLAFTDPTGLYEWAATAGGNDFDNDALLARSKDKSLSKKDRNLAKKYYNFRKKFEDGLQRAKDQLANDKTLTKEQRAEAQRALDSYGSYHKEDTVSVGEVANKNDSSTTGFGVSDGKLHVDLNLNQSNKDPSITIGHEGSHSADFQDLMNARGTPNEASKDISLYASEQRAYFVSSYLAQSLNISPYYPGENSPVWKKSWLKLDSIKRETNRSTGVTNKNYWNKDNNRGPNLSDPKNLIERY